MDALRRAAVRRLSVGLDGDKPPPRGTGTAPPPARWKATESRPSARCRAADALRGAGTALHRAVAGHAGRSDPAMASVAVVAVMDDGKSTVSLSTLLSAQRAGRQGTWYPRRQWGAHPLAGSPPSTAAEPPRCAGQPCLSLVIRPTRRAALSATSAMLCHTCHSGGRRRPSLW